MTAGDLDSPLLGRIVRPADYVRVLAEPMRLRSPHFALHHLAGRPLPPKKPRVHPDLASVSAPVTASLSTELSTDLPGIRESGVDDLQIPGVGATGETPIPANGPARWLGLVVPKRHARRAVTRTLTKRQIRHVATACASRLESGLWVVRQRHPFDAKEFPSAASDALKAAVRAELCALFERAVRGERDRVKPRPASRATPGDAAQGSSCAA